jgi:hypothetical protein
MRRRRRGATPGFRKIVGWFLLPLVAVPALESHRVAAAAPYVARRGLDMTGGSERLPIESPDRRERRIEW